VRLWEDGLTPLVLRVAPVEPPARVWQAIEARIAPSAVPASAMAPQPGGFWSNVGFWRAFATLAGGLATVLLAAFLWTGRAPAGDPMFVAVMDYLLAQFKLVEPLYQLEKAGKFSDEMEHAGKYHQDTGPVDPEGRAFIEGQLLKGGEMLGSIWLTAWKDAVPDTYLRSQLVRRQAGTGQPAK